MRIGGGATCEPTFRDCGTGIPRFENGLFHLGTGLLAKDERGGQGLGLRFWAPALRSPGIQSPQPLYLLSSLAPVQTGARERSPRPKSVLVAVPVARGSGGAPEGEGPQGRPARRIPGGPPSDPRPVMRRAGAGF